MSRFYTLSEWCTRHNVILRREDDSLDAGFIFTKNGHDVYYDYWDVVERPDVIRDQLRDSFHF